MIVIPSVIFIAFNTIDKKERKNLLHLFYDTPTLSKRMTYCWGFFQIASKFEAAGAFQIGNDIEVFCNSSFEIL